MKKLIIAILSILTIANYSYAFEMFEFENKLNETIFKFEDGEYFTLLKDYNIQLAKDLLNIKNDDSITSDGHIDSCGLYNKYDIYKENEIINIVFYKFNPSCHSCSEFDKEKTIEIKDQGELEVILEILRNNK